MRRTSLGLVLFIICFYTTQVCAGQVRKSTIEINNKHQLKIIALAPHIVELLYDIGAGAQIIAATAFSDYPEQAKTLPVVGNYARLQIEKIIQLQPDVIIAWRSGNPNDDLERLKKLGLTIIYSDPKTLLDISNEMRMYGQITGREERAFERAKQFDDRLHVLKDQYANKKRLKVFYEIWPQPLRTISENAWPVQLLSLCGAENIVQQPNQDYPQISIEKVLQDSPDIIIQPISAQHPETPVYNWRKWPLIPAVKHNFIFHPDADKLHRMTPRVLSEIALLCSNIDEARNALTQ